MHKATNLGLRSALRTAFYLLISVLTACGKQVSPDTSDGVDSYSVDVTSYERNGLKITYPTGWALLHDEPGILADRTVAFETEEASRITVYFYESQALTFSDIANDLEKQLQLRTSKDVKHFQREATKVADYQGIKLSWTNLGLSETKNEAKVLELRKNPYPILVQFRLFDSDIERQASNILPFLKGISIDPQGVNL